MPDLLKNKMFLLSGLHKFFEGREMISDTFKDGIFPLPNQSKNEREK